MNTKTALDKWDRFVSSRGLPYYTNRHQVMMRQILDRYPFRKLQELSDRDLMDCINLDTSTSSNKGRYRCFRFFLGHFDAFLSQHGFER